MDHRNRKIIGIMNTKNSVRKTRGADEVAIHEVLCVGIGAGSGVFRILSWEFLDGVCVGAEESGRITHYINNLRHFIKSPYSQPVDSTRCPRPGEDTASNNPSVWPHREYCFYCLAVVFDVASVCSECTALQLSSKKSQFEFLEFSAYLKEYLQIKLGLYRNLPKPSLDRTSPRKRTLASALPSPLSLVQRYSRKSVTCRFLIVRFRAQV